MARKATFIPNVTTSAFIPLADIPEEVKSEMEEYYEACRKQDGRIRIEFDTVDELKTYFRQMASYAAQRPKGALRVRKSPTRNLPDNVADFRVTLDVAENGQRNGKSAPATAHK